MLARLHAEVADQAPVAHVGVAERVLRGVHIGLQSLHGCQGVVAQRIADVGAGPGEIALQYFERERFLRDEMIREGTLRHAGGLDDVSHARSRIATLVHHPQALAQYLLPM